MVSVGFLSGLLANGAASATNRFFTSCAWQYRFSADFFAIVAHADRAQFVNDRAADGMPPISRSGSAALLCRPSPSMMAGEGLLHVLHLLPFVSVQPKWKRGTGMP